MATFLWILILEKKGNIFFAEAQGDQLQFVSPTYKKAIEEFEAYLHIRAPFNLYEGQNVDPGKGKNSIKKLQLPLIKLIFKELLHES